MFSTCKALTNLDLGEKFDTRNVIKMDKMFFNMTSLEKIYIQNSFVTTMVESSEEMFFQNYRLKGGAGTSYSLEHIDAEYARIDDPDNDSPGYFTNRADMP